MHGTPSSRREGEFGHSGALRHRVRLLALDRPGFGGSSPQPDRELADWPGDVAAVLDELGLATVGVLGWSGGGPYALACAAALPERVGACAVLAGATPYARWRGRQGSLADRLVTELSLHAPAAAAALAGGAGIVLRRLPRLATRVVAASLGVPSLPAALGVADERRALGFLTEAFRQGGQATATDYRVLGQPWPFALEQIEVPVRWWHGGRDRLVDPRGAEQLLAGTANVQLTMHPDSGHLLLPRHAEEIFGWLAATLGARR